MSERAATQEVTAERFVMVVIEQIRNIGAGGDVTREPIAAVEIEDAVARNRTDIRPREPGEPVHPAVPHRAADPIPLVGHCDAELMARSVGQQRVLRDVADARMESGVGTLDPPAGGQHVRRAEFHAGSRRRAKVDEGQQRDDRRTAGVVGERGKSSGWQYALERRCNDCRCSGREARWRPVRPEGRVQPPERCANLRQDVADKSLSWFR